MDYENLKNHIFQEIVRIRKITDENQKKKERCKLDEEIRKMNELYEKQEIEMRQAIYNSMKERDIIIKNGTLEAKTLKEKWEDVFAKDLTKDDKKKIYLDTFLWHIFSYKKVVPLKNDEARNAFNKVQKKEVIGFYQDEDDVYVYENTALLKDTDFDMEDDYYLVDSAFQWTYVVTHEKGQCGPYFYSK